MLTGDETRVSDPGEMRVRGNRSKYPRSTSDQRGKKGLFLDRKMGRLVSRGDYAHARPKKRLPPQKKGIKEGWGRVKKGRGLDPFIRRER